MPCRIHDLNGYEELVSPQRFPWWLRWSRICLQCGRPGFNPWVGKIPWRRKWQAILVFWPREFHGERSLVGYNPRVAKRQTRLSDWYHQAHRGRESARVSRNSQKCDGSPQSTALVLPRSQKAEKCSWDLMTLRLLRLVLIGWWGKQWARQLDGEQGVGKWSCG